MWAASYTLQDLVEVFTVGIVGNNDLEAANFGYIHKAILRPYTTKLEWKRLIVLFKVENPLTYYKLCQSMYCGSLGKDCSFSLNGCQMDSFLKRTPKRIPECGVISHALFGQLYDLMKFSQLELDFKPISMLQDLKNPNNQQLNS